MMKYVLLTIIFFGITTMTIANEINKADLKNNKIKEYTLENGLKIIIKQDTRSTAVLSQIWYKVGSIYEPNGITGISHMLEHMMFKGTSEYKVGEIDSIVEENGGSQNAFTANDFTAYYQLWGTDQLDISFAIESSRMKNLTLDDELFQKERQVVIEERRMRTEDSPIAFAYERYLSAIHVNNPRHHPVIGWMTDIEQYTLDDLKKWYETWYAPNNATLVVIGNVNPQEVFLKAKKYFGNIKSSALPDRKNHTDVASVGIKSLNVNHPNTQVDTLIMGFNVPSINSKASDDIYSLIVLDSILGENDSSRFSKYLVRQQEVATAIETYYDALAFNNTTFTILALPTDNYSLLSLENEIFKIINEIQDNGITEAELKRVKTNILAGKIFAMDSITNQANALGTIVSLNLETSFLDDFLENINKTSITDVQNVAKKYLQKDMMTIVKLVKEDI